MNKTAAASALVYLMVLCERTDINTSSLGTIPCTDNSIHSIGNRAASYHLVSSHLNSSVLLQPILPAHCSNVFAGEAGGMENSLMSSRSRRIACIACRQNKVSYSSHFCTRNSCLCLVLLLIQRRSHDARRVKVLVQDVQGTDCYVEKIRGSRE